MPVQDSDSMEAAWSQLNGWFDQDATSNRLSVVDVRAALDNKTKPPGSLGQLEVMAGQLALLQNTLEPVLANGRIIVFGADHGISAEGVSAYPAAVTAQMMENFCHGGAAVCVLAASSNLSVEVVDVGVNADLSHLANVIDAKIGFGTENFIKGAAMTDKQCQAAIDHGRHAISRAHAQGINCVGIGEMGIGNTTSAATIIASILGLTASDVTGRGTGVDDKALQHKISIVQQGIDRHGKTYCNARDVLRCVGGFEIAAMTGGILEASRLDIAVLVDGFISSTAALIATQLEPGTRRNLFFSHRSQESGHARLLNALEATPILNLNMRLGEGSATALAYPLLRSAAAILTEMSTFADAGVSERSD